MGSSQLSHAEPVAVSAPSNAEEAEIRNRTLQLAGPALVEYTLMSLAGVINMIMVGDLGAAAIAAVGLTNQPVFFIQAGFQALSVGATALVARCIGARDTQLAATVARQSLVSTVLLGLLITAPQVLAARAIVDWMGAEPDVVKPALDYMLVMMSGTVFTVIPLVVSAILRGAGNSRTPMVLNVLTNVLNVVFGYVLIYGYFGFPRLEVLGAGIGTIGARAVTSVLYVLALYSKGCVLPLSFKQSHRLDMKVISRIMHVGIPAALEQFVRRGGQTVFAKTVASLGTVAYAAHQLTVNAESFAFNPPTAFQVSATTLVGQYLGADRPDMAERSGYVSLRLSMITMGLIGTACYIFARQIMGIYTDDVSVIEMAVPNMRLFAVALPGMATSFVMVGSLRGAGDTRWPLYVSIASIWVARVGLAYILAIRLGLGLRGAWIAMVGDHCVRAVLSFLRFRSGGWKRSRV